MKQHFAIIALITLSACGQSQPSTQTDTRDGTKSGKAVSEYLKPIASEQDLIARFDKAVKVQGEILIVNDDYSLVPGLDTYFLPISAPWVIKCGFLGISVDFGTTVVSEDAHAASGVEIQLSMQNMDAQTCGPYGTALATHVQELVRHAMPPIAPDK